MCTVEALQMTARKQVDIQLSDVSHVDRRRLSISAYLDWQDIIFGHTILNHEVAIWY